MIKPEWLRKAPTKFRRTQQVRKKIADGGLNTVCKSARCPNMGECFSNGVATFMILGDKCSRNCGFCAVSYDSRLDLPDPGEPNRVANAAASLGLSHVVVTSVARDDLFDGGAKQFAKTIRAIRAKTPSATVEVLTPDFRGNTTSIDTVIKAKPDIFNHNVETTPPLYKKVRPSADYTRSLNLIERVKNKNNGIMTKSGMMLGLGEREKDVVDVMKDLQNAGCDLLTIGQYLQPTLKNLKVEEYIEQKVFDELADTGEKMGFKKVFAGPFVRSSYHAKEIYKAVSTLD